MTFDELTPEQVYEAGYREGFRDGERCAAQWWPVAKIPISNVNCAPRAMSPRVYPQAGGASNKAGGAR